MTIQVYVKNQNLSLSPQQKNLQVVAGSKNYLKMKFVFQTQEWKHNRPIYAIFTHGDKSYKKILGIEEGLNKNECYVAPEVVKEGKFFVSIYCDNLITTDKIEIKVLPTGYTEKIENQDNTLSMMEQMNQLMYKYTNLCNEIYKECKKIREENK